MKMKTVVIISTVSIYAALQVPKLFLPEDDSLRPHKDFISSNAAVIGSMMPDIVAKCLPASVELSNDGRAILVDMISDAFVGDDLPKSAAREIEDKVRQHVLLAERRLSKSEFDRFGKIVVGGDADAKRSCLHDELAQSIERYQETEGGRLIRVSNP